MHPDPRGYEELEYTDPYDGVPHEFWIKLEHVGRYVWAADRLLAAGLGRGRPGPGLVLDAAAGSGYGSKELAQAGVRVIGAERNERALASANTRYAAYIKEALLEFRLADLDGPFVEALHDAGAGTFDAVVCFETLEHLENPGGVLRGFQSLLKPGGLLLLSVPNPRFENVDTAGQPTNPFHKHLFDSEELDRLLLAAGFEPGERWGQAGTNLLMRRENQLLRYRRFEDRFSEKRNLHHPEVIRSLAFLLAYPTQEQLDDSYTLILEAQVKNC